MLEIVRKKPKNLEDMTSNVWAFSPEDAPKSEGEDYYEGSKHCHKGPSQWNYND